MTEALGSVEGADYHAPNGAEFQDGCTPAVARLLIEAQPSMRELKQVIGYSPKALMRTSPESSMISRLT